MNSDENDSSYDLESDDQEMVHYKEVQVITENDQKSQNLSQQQLHQSLTHSDMQQQKSPLNYNQSQYSNQIQDLLLDNKQTIDESKNENMVYTNQSNKLMKRINSDQSLFMNNNTTTKNNNITNICIDQNILQDTAKIRKSLSDDQTYVVILKNLLTSQMYNQTTIYLSLNDKKSVINSLKLNHQQLDKNKVLSQLIESEKFKKNQQIYKKFHYQSPKKSQQQSSSFFNQKLDQISNINHQTQSQKKSFFGNSSSKNSLFQEKSPQIFNFHLPKNNSKNQEQQQQEQQQQIQMQNLQECDETNQNENDGNSQIQKIQNNNNKVDFSNDVDFDMQQLNIDNFKSFSQSSSSSSSLYTYVTCDDSEDDELENTQQIENNKSIFSQFQYKSNNNSNNNNTNSNSKKNNNKRKYSIKNESSLKSNNNSIRKIQSDQKSKISKQSSSGKKIGKASIENKLFKTQGNEINISAKKLKFDQMQQQKQTSSNKKNIKNSAQKSKSSIKKRIKIKKKKKVKKQKCSILISLPENDNNNSNYQKKHRLSIDSPTPSEQERESKYKNIFKISQQLTDCTNNNNNNSNLQSQQKNQQKIQQQQQQLSELKKSEKKHKIDIQKQYNPVLQQNNSQNVKNQLQVPNQDYKNNNQNQNQNFFQQNILSNKIVDKTIQNNESQTDIKVKKYEEGLDEEQEQKQQIQQQQQQQQVKQVVPFHKRELSLQKSSSEYNLSSFEKQLLNKKQFFKVYDQVMTQMTSNNSNSQKPNQQKIQSDQQKIKEIGKKLFQGER
ncbi:hypothetical protein PPERSA_10124 [Pseudocohnilembus persalinus]|uniref:Uncharacterized protein n=1 Tax=Pseudocohnilembus persalinus TaxID=266149 RepID=A0A0V0R0J9_PSEPJ|nr:hypothetical protein PPERSA_10124 [Pseudocohnilembus persalinus]|eukprot:KRX07840.1 hypothetical protein PPERSA_10124 [Pseudocohnilembus persalinus]